MAAPTTLFDDFERTATDRDGFQVESYTFLNSSAVPEAIKASQKITDWSEGFTLTNEFLRRFRSKTNKQHIAALFELFIFYYFKSQGFMIEAVPIGAKPTPDFKIELKGQTIYIECTCSSKSGIEESIETLQNVILDSFKSIDKQQHFINIEWLQSNFKNPSLKRIRHYIREFINSPNRPPFLLIDDTGWRIKITLMPASPAIKRGVGLMTHPVGIVTPEANVLTALNDKRPARYQLESPYIIALYSEDMFLDYLDMDLALHDGARFLDKLPLKRGRGTAFYIAHTHLINFSVSAVLLVQRLVPYFDDLPRMMLFNHPEPKYPLKNEYFPMAQQTYQRVDVDTFKIIELP